MSAKFFGQNFFDYFSATFSTFFSATFFRLFSATFRVRIRMKSLRTRVRSRTSSLCIRVMLGRATIRGQSPPASARLEGLALLLGLGLGRGLVSIRVSLRTKVLHRMSNNTHFVVFF